MYTHTIRMATWEDSPRIARLFDRYRMFYQQPSDLALAESFIRERVVRGEAAILVCVTDPDEIVGFAQLYPSFSSVSAAPTWILNDLFVDDSHRRKGVGRALLEAVLVFGRESGAAYVSLETGLMNQAAQKLYEETGFQRQAETLLYSCVVG